MANNKENLESSEFDAVYKSPQLYYGEQPSKELVLLINNNLLIRNASVLELGCGEGRDTFFLAKEGFSVLAIDSSEKAINKLQKRAEELNLNIDAQCIDIRTFNFPLNKYDLLVADTVLDQFTINELPKIIRSIKSCIKRGGIIFVRDFTIKDPGFTHRGHASDTADFVNHYFEINELNSDFKDFNILSYEEKMEHDKSHGKPHEHGLVIIVARRPASAN